MRVWRQLIGLLSLSVANPMKNSTTHSRRAAGSSSRLSLLQWRSNVNISDWALRRGLQLINVCLQDENLGGVVANLFLHDTFDMLKPLLGMLGFVGQLTTVRCESCNISGVFPQGGLYSQDARPRPSVVHMVVVMSCRSRSFRSASSSTNDAWSSRSGMCRCLPSAGIRLFRPSTLLATIVNLLMLVMLLGSLTLNIRERLGASGLAGPPAPAAQILAAEKAWLLAAPRPGPVAEPRDYDAYSPRAARPAVRDRNSPCVHLLPVVHEKNCST